MRTIINAMNICKSYEQSDRLVLDHVTCKIEIGDFVAIMGPSGSGKSTLLYTLSGMEEIDSGNIFFDEVDLSTCTENELTKIRREKMGFVFQSAGLLANLSILDNILLKEDCRRRDKCSTSKTNAVNLRKRAMELMEQMGIAEIAERSITKVSGGQLQRAGICRALLGNPDVIFADEPTGALNSEAATGIMDIFENLNKQRKTIVLVTHDDKVAARAKRVVRMQDGVLTK